MIYLDLVAITILIFLLVHFLKSGKKLGEWLFDEGFVSYLLKGFSIVFLIAVAVGRIDFSIFLKPIF